MKDQKHQNNVFKETADKSNEISKNQRSAVIIKSAETMLRWSIN